MSNDSLTRHPECSKRAINLTVDSSEMRSVQFCCLPTGSPGAATAGNRCSYRAL
jgi:hypothetical protein